MCDPEGNRCGQVDDQKDIIQQYSKIVNLNGRELLSALGEEKMDEGYFVKHSLEYWRNAEPILALLIHLSAIIFQFVIAIDWKIQIIGSIFVARKA